jgi:hypothetical protein
VYRRPDTTRRVFEEIRKAKPKQLFIGADGPKANNAEEEKNVAEVRAIAQAVDWDCEVRTHFQKQNVGSKIAESSAISFFFDNVEEGIILEDDCMPDQSFFHYCAEMLNKYRDDKRIMHISGNNFNFGKSVGEASYYFSKFNFAWGWATWKRAWLYYDVNMRSFPEFKAQNQMNNVFDDRRIQRHFIKFIDKVYRNKLDSWDCPWAYTIWRHNGLCIVPNRNLVSNIGFGAKGTYCADEHDIKANIKAVEMDQITHPEFILANKEADAILFHKLYKITIIKAFTFLIRLLQGKESMRKLKDMI